MNFPETTVNLYEKLGREELSRRARFRVARICPEIQGDLITLPEDCHMIISVTWKGVPLEKRNSASHIKMFASPNGTGLPREYVPGNITSRQTIQIYPFPTELFTAGDPDADLSSKCVITYHATCGVEFPLPGWMEFQVLNYYIQAKACLTEGATKDLRMAKYFQSRFDLLSSQVISRHTQNLKVGQQRTFNNLHSFGNNQVNFRRPAFIPA